jgi:hypothetical protein
LERPKEAQLWRRVQATLRKLSWSLEARARWREHQVSGGASIEEEKGFEGAQYSVVASKERRHKSCEREFCYRRSHVCMLDNFLEARLSFSYFKPYFLLFYSLRPNISHCVFRVVHI